MEAFFSWVGAVFGALFAVAVVVAWWEHLARNARPPAPQEAAAPRAVKVDVQLDALAAEPAAPPAPAAAAAPLAADDAAQRRATLDVAMSRMARPSPDNIAWTETSPMVLHPPAEEPAPVVTPSQTRTRA